MFVISVTHEADSPEIKEFMVEHLEFLDKYFEQGNFLASGVKVSRDGGIILAKAENKEELDAILAEDPFYKHNFADFKVTEFIPSKYAADFEVFI